jgi:hypothetical protein
MAKSPNGAAALRLTFRRPNCSGDHQLGVPQRVLSERDDGGMENENDSVEAVRPWRTASWTRCRASCAPWPRTCRARVSPSPVPANTTEPPQAPPGPGDGETASEPVATINLQTEDDPERVREPVAKLRSRR